MNLIERQNNEALERLKILNVHPNVIKEFEEGLLNYSEPTGALFWLTNEISKKVSEIEDKYNITVYHVIRSPTTLGEMYSFLYVGKEEEDWKLEREDLQAGYPLAYVYNKTDDYCSEFGFIGIKPQFGGVIRTC